MQIIEDKITKDNLLKNKKIDDEFYNSPITNIDWYLERYTKNHKVFFIR